VGVGGCFTNQFGGDGQTATRGRELGRLYVRAGGRRCGCGRRRRRILYCRRGSLSLVGTQITNEDLDPLRIDYVKAFFLCPQRASLIGTSASAPTSSKVHTDHTRMHK
jgi:hypothetical protein